MRMTNQNTTVRVVRNATRAPALSAKAGVGGGAALRVYKKYLPNVQKRDGRIVPFEFNKVGNAIHKAMLATNEGSEDEAVVVAHKVAGEMMRIAKTYKNFLPTVEGCQDEVERQLILADYAAAAKAYILYRAERAKVRKEQGAVPEHVRLLAAESKKYFKNNPLGEFVYLRTYARWIESEQRRETWIETVDRYVGFMKENLGDKLAKKEYAEIREAILKQEVMPSMRAMQFAGAPAKKCNTCFYNCSFTAPAKLEDFAEIMYLSMQGCGVGYAVESQNIQQLPQIEKQTGEKLPTHVVADNKEGWCDSLTLGLRTWYGGKDIDFDFSMIRPAGSRLKTMGGKASGPEPLRSLLAFARERILRRQGRRLRNIDAHDIICKIGECVVAGGVRRTAMISLSDLDDVEIRDAKKGQFFLTDSYRSVANNSAVYEVKPSNAELMDEWVALMKSGTGERGIFNRGSLEKTMPKRRQKLLHKKYGKKGNSIGQVGTNPCVTGDTLVYVADGRGNVPIKQLAEEGKDVPVFALDSASNVTVRIMRNPRVTGHSVAIYKVTLDDGSIVRTTANHKLRLKSGEYKEVKDLRQGDSLHLLTRFEASIKDIFPTANSRSQDYWWINNGKASNIGEHRAIASFHHNTEIARGYVVHHRDRNAQNNHPLNLEILTKEAHDTLHGVLMRGNSNPMRRAQYEWNSEKWEEYKAKHSANNSGTNNANFSGVTDTLLREHALLLAKQLGRRFSNGDWITYAKERGLPQSFSKWRRDHLGGMLGFAKWAAYTLGLGHVDADPRVLKSYEKYTAAGYNCDIENGQLVIHKSCEVCERTFTTSITTREYGVCSISCGLKKTWKDEGFRKNTIKKIRATHEKNRIELREQQSKIYSNLKFSLKREPFKREWQIACKQHGLSVEITRASAPFKNYGELQEYASMYNHKVVSVTRCGVADVYNGTVDEFHNFFIGGFASSTRAGKQKMSYLNNLQCGEIILQSKQFCNLSEVIARADDTEKTLLRKARLATLLGTYQSTLTNFNYISKDWTDNCQAERLLGVSITGQWDSPVVRDGRVMRKMRAVSIRTNTTYAKRFGISTSTSITCVKPSGTVSQTFNCSSGIHPRHSQYYIRRVRISATDSLYKMMRDQGVQAHPEVGQNANEATTFVLEFPVKAPNGSLYKNDLTAMQQLEYWKTVKLNYTEHNPSATISVGDEEWVAVVAWISDNWDIIGGLSFLPRENHVYRLAPYESVDRKTYETLASKFPVIDYSKLIIYERTDETEQAKELACAGGTCEIV
jgi:hypothetical protein